MYRTLGLRGGRPGGEEAEGPQLLRLQEPLFEALRRRDVRQDSHDRVRLAVKT